MSVPCILNRRSNEGRCQHRASSQSAPVDRPGMLIMVMLLIAFAACGLRFTNIGTKVFWHDEAYSSLRVFGHTGPAYYTSMFDGNIHSISDLQGLQHVNPELGMAATFTALASRPEHPPLYYLMARIWAELFEDPVIALRSLSAIFGLLLLPSVYWLARELFGDSRVSWVAVTLAAASPLNLLYAQEARQYALWSVLTVLSGAAMLHALRRGTRRALYGYALTVTLGLYTHIMFAFTVVVHAVYLMLTRREYPRDRVKACALSLAFGALAFIPWLVLFINAIPDVSQVTGWMRRPVAALTLMQGWLTSINRLFFDFAGSEYLIPVSTALALIAVLAVLRRTSSRVWLLPALMLAIMGGAVIVPDLLGGGRRSLETRYLLPGLLTLELCVAYLIGSGMSLHSRSGRIFGLTGLLIIACGIYSQLAIVSSATWWNKSFSANNAQIADMINAADRPLLISTTSDINPGELLSLSYLLHDRVRLLLLRDPALPELPDGFDRYFIFNPSWDLSRVLELNYTLQRVNENVALWELHSRYGRWHATR